MSSLDAYRAIGRFLETSRQPVVMDPGEDPIPVGADNFSLKRRGETVTLGVWSEMRNLSAARARDPLRTGLRHRDRHAARERHQRRSELATVVAGCKPHAYGDHTH